MNAFEIIEREITKYPKTFVIGHIQPDGDCIGASLGLKYLIEENYGDPPIAVNQMIARFDFLGSWRQPGSVDYPDAFVIHVDNSARKRSADPLFMAASSILKIVKFGGGGHIFACVARLDDISKIPDVVKELESNKRKRVVKTI